MGVRRGPSVVPNCLFLKVSLSMQPLISNKSSSNLFSGYKFLKNLLNTESFHFCFEAKSAGFSKLSESFSFLLVDSRGVLAGSHGVHYLCS